MEENRIPEANAQLAKKPKIWRYAFMAIFAILAFLAFSVYRYNLVLNSGIQHEKDLAARLEAEKQAKMADTFGGKTPAETLQLYIDALKNGDFELASKYFIESKRQADLDSYKNVKPEDIANIIQLLEKTVQGKGGYSADGLRYTIDRPLTTDFELYPNGIWKIIEI